MICGVSGQKRLEVSAWMIFKNYFCRSIFFKMWVEKLTIMCALEAKKYIYKSNYE